MGLATRDYGQLWRGYLMVFYSLSDRINGVVNHPSVTACPQLQKHLIIKKGSLQKQLNSLMSQLETARFHPLSLESILTPEQEETNDIK